MTETPLTPDELVEQSARAIGKIDAMGRRGTEKVTADEIIAMAGLLALMGAPVTPYVFKEK